MDKTTPYILAIGNDLFFMPQIEAAARQAGFGFEWLDQPLNEADFVTRLGERLPALVVLDLNTSLPWPHWLPAAKAAAATGAAPWLAFGSHMNPRRLAAARHAGADKVVPKSQFATELASQLAALSGQ